MPKAPLPPDEPARLEALRRYRILDTDPEPAYDDLTLLASHICDAPIALISLIDRERQWFKSRVGTDRAETPRDVAFCAHAILGRDLLIVPDATADPRFADNPLVQRDPRIRFYAGAPLVTPDGFALGTLCVLDHVPRALTDAQQLALRALSRHAMTQLELRRHVSELQAAARNLRALVDASPLAIMAVGPDGTVTFWNPAAERLFGWTEQEVLGRPNPIVPEDKRYEFAELLEIVLGGRGFTQKALRRQKKDGTLIDILLSTAPLLDGAGRITGVVGIIAERSPTWRPSGKRRKEARKE